MSRTASVRTNRARIEEENAEKRSEAEKAATGVDGKSVQLIRQASNTGQLYGSVSARDIAEALEGVGAHVAKSQVVLDRPIKALGVHDIKIALHPEVAVMVKVNVGRSPEEPISSPGIDVMSQMFDSDAAPVIEDEAAEWLRKWWKRLKRRDRRDGRASSLKRRARC